MKLANAHQMRELDQEAIDRYGIPGIVLMENAGRGTVDKIIQTFGDPAGKTVSIFVGPGNNGGDGLVIARHLHQLGAEPVVFLLVSPEKIKGDAAINLQIVRKLPIPIIPLLEGDAFDRVELSLAGSWLTVDALFGTGLKREVAGHFAEVITIINQYPVPVVSVDIPSGLDSDTGNPLGACIKAQLTVTYGLAKPGHFVYPGAEYVGELSLVDIGIPPEAVYNADIRCELLEKEDLCQWLPDRNALDHKGTFGHLLIIAGSPGKTGAAILSARGALRCGVGLVSLCAPQVINTVYESCLVEAMTIPVSGTEKGQFSVQDFQRIMDAAAGKQAVVIGPGLGTDPETAELVLQLYSNLDLPMVVDADALNILAAFRSEIKNPPAARILTPHPGEMARLTGISSKEIQLRRLEMARSFAEDNGVILLLKGAGTVIADGAGEARVNPTGNPGLAAGGMGDVLSGLIGGFLAQGVHPWHAACLGAYVHGLAADGLSETMGMDMGYTASELAAELPEAILELLDFEQEK
ncbi:MAG: NAD(P)H-hydrate dehydratase [Proteobacteria bacterium]|nr:NAD(P)H-hydrate dehydratase [Pseudomonadota bacterium]MBU1708393.1 NAD(P)H-hydrate dehydratase [Pseudomonadota bacterium]